MEEYRCSFCECPESERKQMIVSENKTVICNECVISCMKILLAHVENSEVQKLPDKTD